MSGSDIPIRLYADNLGLFDFSLVSTAGHQQGIGYTAAATDFPGGGFGASNFLLQGLELTCAPHDALMFFDAYTVISGVMRSWLIHQTNPTSDLMIDIQADTGSEVTFENVVIERDIGGAGLAVGQRRRRGYLPRVSFFRVDRFSNC